MCVWILRFVGAHGLPLAGLESGASVTFWRPSTIRPRRTLVALHSGVYGTTLGTLVPGTLLPVSLALFPAGAWDSGDITALVTVYSGAWIPLAHCEFWSLYFGDHLWCWSRTVWRYTAYLLAYVYVISGGQCQHTHHIITSDWPYWIFTIYTYQRLFTWLLALSVR